MTWLYALLPFALVVGVAWIFLGQDDARHDQAVRQTVHIPRQRTPHHPPSG